MIIIISKFRRRNSSSDTIKNLKTLELEIKVTGRSITNPRNDKIKKSVLESKLFCRFAVSDGGGDDLRADTSGDVVIIRGTMLNIGRGLSQELEQEDEILMSDVVLEDLEFSDCVEEF